MVSFETCISEKMKFEKLGNQKANENSDQP